MQTKKDEIQIEDETSEELHVRLEKLTKDVIGEDANLKTFFNGVNRKVHNASIQGFIRKDQRDRISKTKKRKPQSYNSIAKLENNKEENNNSDTREENIMQELIQAKMKYEDARETLYKLIDQKLSEHSMSYYIREKGIGSKSIQDLKYKRDRMQVPSLIHNLERMI